MEVYLSKELSYHPMEDDDGESLSVVRMLSNVLVKLTMRMLRTFDGTVQPHFYGELAKTEQGCQVLHDKGHFAEFAHFIRLHGSESDDVEIIAKLKSILWAVGNIAAAEGGLHFLEEEELIPVMLEIAEQSSVLSLRG